MQNDVTRRTDAPAAHPRRGRWSAIDTAVVLLIAAAVAVQVWQAILVRREQQAQKTPTMYDVIFTVSDVRAEVLDEVNALDVLYLCEDGMPLGVIGEYENEDGTRHVALTRDGADTLPAGTEAASDDSAETQDAQAETQDAQAETQDAQAENAAVSPFGPYDGTPVSATGCMICTEGEQYEGGLLFPDTGFVLTPGSEITVRTDKVLLTIRIQTVSRHES